MTLSIFTINIFFFNTLGYKDNPFTMIIGVQSNSKYRPVSSVEFGFKPENSI